MALNSLVLALENMHLPSLHAGVSSTPESFSLASRRASLSPFTTRNLVKFGLSFAVRDSCINCAKCFQYIANEGQVSPI